MENSYRSEFIEETYGTFKIWRLCGRMSQNHSLAMHTGGIMRLPLPRKDFACTVVLNTSQLACSILFSCIILFFISNLISERICLGIFVYMNYISLIAPLEVYLMRKMWAHSILILPAVCQISQKIFWRRKRSALLMFNFLELWLFVAS